MRTAGFTLAELLLALVILGVIATFTIPKVLTAQQNNQYKASAKEVASMFAGAFEAYKQSNTVTASLVPASLTPYMNYVAVDTNATVDSDPFWNTTFNCGDGVHVCLRLHNGGMLITHNAHSFGNTAATNGIWMEFDPDAKASTVKSVQFYILWNGRLSSAGQANGSIYNSSGLSMPTGPGNDPAWFNWN